MFGGRHSAARMAEELLADIHPPLIHSGTTYDAPGGDLHSLSAVSPDQTSPISPDKRRAGDGAVLSLIPHAVVAIAVSGALFGAGFSMLGGSKENMAVPRVGNPEATIIPMEPAALARQATAIPAPAPTPSPSAATLPDTGSAPPKAISLPAPGPIDSPSAAPTTRIVPPALGEKVVPTDPVSRTSRELAENPRQQQQREARIRFLRQQMARIERQLTRPHLSAAETRRLDRQNAYWSRALERTLAAP